MENGSKMVRGNVRPTTFLAPFFGHRSGEAFWQPFACLLVPFWPPLAAFWLPLAPFGLPFGSLPFWLTFGALWLTFGALGSLLVILALDFLAFGAP